MSIKSWRGVSRPGGFGALVPSVIIAFFFASTALATPATCGPRGDTPRLAAAAHACADGQGGEPGEPVGPCDDGCPCACPCCPGFIATDDRMPDLTPDPVAADAAHLAHRVPERRCKRGVQPGVFRPPRA